MLDGGNELSAWDRDHFFHPSTHMGTHARGESPNRIMAGAEGVGSPAAGATLRSGQRQLMEFVEVYARALRFLARIMALVEAAGTGFAFPSQTLYFGRDQPPDEGRARAAAGRVQAWREESSLPFPNFSPQQTDQIRGSIAYPPPGSSAAAPGSVP